MTVANVYVNNNKTNGNDNDIRLFSQSLLSGL